MGVGGRGWGGKDPQPRKTERSPAATFSDTRVESAPPGLSVPQGEAPVESDEKPFLASTGAVARTIREPLASPSLPSCGPRKGAILLYDEGYFRLSSHVNSVEAAGGARRFGGSKKKESLPKSKASTVKSLPGSCVAKSPLKAPNPKWPNGPPLFQKTGSNGASFRTNP